MDEIDDIKRRAGIVSESVIYRNNPDDPMNPEVLVNGMGRYSLKTLKDHVRKKINSINDMLEKNDDSQAWSNAKYLIVDHAALHEMLKTIEMADSELEGKDVVKH